MNPRLAPLSDVGGLGLLSHLLQGGQVWVEAARTLDLGEEICALWKGCGQNPRLSCAPGLGRRRLLS